MCIVGRTVAQHPEVSIEADDAMYIVGSGISLLDYEVELEFHLQELIQELTAANTQIYRVRTSSVARNFTGGGYNCGQIKIKSNMALILVGKPQPSIKLNRLIR